MKILGSFLSRWCRSLHLKTHQSISRAGYIELSFYMSNFLELPHQILLSYFLYTRATSSVLLDCGLPACEHFSFGLLSKQTCSWTDLAVQSLASPDAGSCWSASECFDRSCRSLRAVIFEQSRGSDRLCFRWLQLRTQMSFTSKVRIHPQQTSTTLLCRPRCQWRTACHPD